jgi:hypothetical protein
MSVDALHLEAAFTFCKAIGIPIEWKAGVSGFVPGIRIEQGVILVDRGAKPGDLLHEAAHLAIMPSSFRSKASTNLHQAFKSMMDCLNEHDPESAIAIAIMQCGDTEATAWSWAAGKACGIPDELIITDSSYDGVGAEIRTMLSLKGYLGINGLSRAGFCRVRGDNAFPHMNKWMQDAS